MSNEKRALIATFLSIAFLLAWQHWFAPRPVPPAAAGGTETAPVAGSAGAGPAAAGVAEAGPKPAAVEEERLTAGIPPAVSGGPGKILLLESRTARIKVTSSGARVLSWRLLQYFDDEGHPLELVPDHSTGPESLPLEMVVPGDPARTRRLNEASYDCSGPRRTSGGQEIACRWSDGRGEAVEKVLTVPDDGYLVTLRVRVVSKGSAPLVAWAPGLIRDEGPARYGAPARSVHLVLGNGGKLERVTAQKAGDWKVLDAPRAWAGVEGQYFATAFAPEKQPARFALFGRERSEERPEEVGVAWAPGGDGTARLFVGPKSYDLLRGIDSELRLGLRRLVDFGFFEFIAVPLFLSLKWLSRHLRSFGLAIIVLTVAIKVAFYPITQGAMIKMRRLQKQMKRLQPKIQHLKEQYARKTKSIDNRQKMNQEMMELYRREGVNPMAGMGGCLPLLLQIPILWALYSLLSAAIELRRAPFLYLEDLSARDPYFITPIIMGATMWIQQRMSGTAVPDAAQRMVLNLMPLFMTWVFKDFPSGLVLYWLVNNLLGIGQQYLINRQADAVEVPAAGERGGGRRG